MFNNQLYSMSKLGNWDDAIAKNTANQILTGIKNDIALGKFNCRDSQELFTQYHPLSELIDSQAKIRSAVDCLDLVNQKLDSQKLRDRNLHQTKNFLTRYGKPIKSPDDALKFWQWLQGESKGNAKTINRHLESLKPICPHFSAIAKLKTENRIDDVPFSKDEISKILKVFDDKFRHYLPFIKFLFATGCRPNEAAAIKWSSIDFQRKTITICEAIGFDNEGKKVKKSTKTGASRTFPMSQKLIDCLNQQHNAVSPHPIDSHVFLTPENSIIDIRNFRSRVWIKALELANVPYRRLYNTRHTFISYYLSEHKDFQKCAAITHGTKSGVQTLIKHYAHLVNDIETIDLWD